MEVLVNLGLVILVFIVTQQIMNTVVKYVRNNR